MTSPDVVFITQMRAVNTKIYWEYVCEEYTRLTASDAKIISHVQAGDIVSEDLNGGNWESIGGRGGGEQGVRRRRRRGRRRRIKMTMANDGMRKKKGSKNET